MKVGEEWKLNSQLSFTNELKLESKWKVEQSMKV